MKCWCSGCTMLLKQISLRLWRKFGRYSESHASNAFHLPITIKSDGHINYSALIQPNTGPLLMSTMQRKLLQLRGGKVEVVSTERLAWMGTL